ncbi:MAG: FliH/SctL family protein [Planctomycetota bacterium]
MQQHRAEQAARAEAGLARTRDALIQAASELSALRRQVLDEAEQQLLDLAVDIASKVLAQEIRAERYEIEPIVREALSRVSGGDEVVVRLNPSDHRRCGLEEADLGEGVRLVADASVQPAECRVETGGGVVASTVEGQLDEMREALKAPESS